MALLGSEGGFHENFRGKLLLICDQNLLIGNNIYLFQNDKKV